MKNKIKLIMEKEEGFTLFELLAVIVILGIIVVIAIPAVGGIISRADEDVNEAEDGLVVDSARLYYTTEDEPNDTVTVEELQSLGYLDLRDSDELSETVTRTLNNSESDDGVDTYTYEFVRNKQKKLKGLFRGLSFYIGEIS